MVARQRPFSTEMYRADVTNAQKFNGNEPGSATTARRELACSAHTPPELGGHAGACILGGCDEHSPQWAWQMKVTTSRIVVTS